MFKKKLVLPFIIILVLMLSACTADKVVVDPNPQVPPTSEQTPNKDNVDTNLDAEVTITPMQAFDIYLQKYPDTNVRKIGLDYDRGIYVYKVEGFSNGVEYELKLHSTSGDIIKEETENDDDAGQDGEISKVQVEKVENLVNKTLAEAGDRSKLDEWTLKAKNGRVILEVEIDVENGTDIEYNYDVETGEIISD